MEPSLTIQEIQGFVGVAQYFYCLFLRISAQANVEVLPQHGLIHPWAAIAIRSDNAVQRAAATRSCAMVRFVRTSASTGSFRSRCLAVSIAGVILGAGGQQTHAAPPPDPAVPDAPAAGSGAILPTAPGAPVGCFGITANPRGLALCDGSTYNLPDGTITQTVWDVVRVGYGTTATFTGYQAVAERPAGSYFSPITVFSGPSAYAPANATFIDATVYMAPERLANAVATTQGTLNLRNATIALNPATTYLPTQTLAALAAFGGGVVNVDSSVINIPTTIAYGLQVMNTDPGGGLPGQNGALAKINANRTVVRLGSGSGSSVRTFGGFVAGESELNVTNGTFELGNYSIGIYNVFSASYVSPVTGSRSHLPAAGQQQSHRPESK